MIPGSGRSPGEGNGNSLQYSFPENPMGRGGWWATVHGVAELDTTECLTGLNEQESTHQGLHYKCVFLLLGEYFLCSTAMIYVFKITMKIDRKKNIFLYQGF